ncbi:FKBP-type peptidyl-prolyl cis-trans isomerase FklB [Geothermobacter ehrlichii]|uniref:Peptidyl-prolyl cis-trans isomerase n=1 Tax=Geothermobacter ehrlichii TaxID=213224 RepID=A0A5D3WH59_9BACT|nr:FKBP-type peptidyl-prolyl cis-trans isomerase [Geothermobacter ehrlichii]TYO97113.1 FKBP-type peptidyl-prolyl cis-trans isomerase FklB [Geothermobacter ehrlichii]
MRMTTLAASLLLALAMALPVAAADKKPTTLEERVSYGIGMNIGRDFKGKGFEVNPDLLARGIKDVLAGGELLMTEDEVRQTIMELQQVLQEKAAAKNRAEGEAFLAANRKKDGVKVTASGLQYRVIREGDGATPGPDSTVTVNYRGALVDGTEFDSSYKRGKPATFQLNRVIRGWTEGLQLMKAGGKYEFVLPADLAYGEQGAGQVIGPNSVLIFEVELLEVN